MSPNSVLNAVQHYQRSIEKNPADVARLLHCVGKLYKIPITVELLQQTGVGRTVNGLRKYEGELSVAAEAVVNKWKQLVATENDTRADNQCSDNEQDSDEDEEKHSSPEKNEQRNYDETIKTQKNNQKPTKQYSKSVNETEKSEINKKHSKSHSKNPDTPSSSSSHKTHEHSKHKSDRAEKSKENSFAKESHKREEERDHKSQNRNHKNDKMENTKDKKYHSEHTRKEETGTPKNNSMKKENISKEILVDHSSNNKKHKHHDKHKSSRDKEKSKSEQKTRNSSSSNATKSSLANSNDGPSTSTAMLVDEKSTSSNMKRRLEEVGSEKESSSKKSKSSKQQNDKKQNQSSDKNEGDIDDGIDSSMGANFADVLGMLNMPKKKAKKSLTALKSTSPKSTQKTSESDKPKSSPNSKTNETNRRTEMPTSSISQKKLQKKPELLTSKAKLPPLDPSIVLDLPVISNNYKPLPLNPMIMDCVFNSTTSSSSRAPPPRLLSEAEALSHGISSKTMRTKVYSGVKTGQLLQVPTLFDLCIRVIQKNIDALEYTGGVPFDVLRPVLERATPTQLLNFEEYNPYLMEDSDVLWKLHVERNYRGNKREEMESWREMFLRCQETQERRLSMLAENIKQSQKAIALPVRKTQLAFVDSMVKPPRNVLRKQEQYGTKSKPVATPAARVAALSSVTPNAAKQGDARLRVAAAFSQDPVKLSNSFTRPKKAPLMAKTLQFMRGRLKR